MNIVGRIGQTLICRILRSLSVPGIEKRSRLEIHDLAHDDGQAVNRGRLAADDQSAADGGDFQQQIDGERYIPHATARALPLLRLR